MLNISPVSVNKEVDRDIMHSLRKAEARTSGRVLLRLLIIQFIILLIIVFLPWTQNISAKGKVTTLNPEQRPQTIHTIIPGRIEQWYVREGDYVEKGDTILHISEIKDQYFDPQLLPRTQAQLTAKEQAVVSYEDKIQALRGQIQALEETARLKLEQAQNKLTQAHLKVQSDSIDFEAAKINYDIALEQYQRLEKLYNDGLKSLTELENRNNTLQKAQAYRISAENKLLTSENEVINAKVELTSIQAQYRKEIAKARSDLATAVSTKYDAEIDVTKMQNTYSNYSMRSGMYYILAPQDGYVTQAIQSGLGETVKEGEEIVSIMPARYDLAVEMYVRPIDLPLIEKGQPVRIQFDGWPAIVFSGWPNTSFGTYGGRVFAIDNFISANGMYRVLVQSDPEDEPWPDALRVGSGTWSMLLLKDVPIWYELWRQINGFPPDYYRNDMSKAEETKNSALKLLK